MAIFSYYLLFTRVPDYFEGEYIKGVVSSASFSAENNSPLLIVDYNAGSEKLKYQTDMWFLKKYKPGETVTIIYNPADPAVSSIYAFIGYWIRWPELLFTSAFFILLFAAAKSITGKGNMQPVAPDDTNMKRKYDD